MTGYVALLRAVNVGGTGRLPMSQLAAMCVDAGLEQVKTYIASGNVVFASGESPADIEAVLAARLTSYFDKPQRVHVRTAAEMARIVAENPFAGEPAKQTSVIFLDSAPPADTLEQVRNRTTERIALGSREIYVAYGGGMGTSKLKIPAATDGTARNLNTIAKLAELTAARA